MARAVESTSKLTKSSLEKGMAEGGSPPHLQLVDGPIAPNARIGERMRASRLSKGLEIAEVAKKLRLRREYIEAMEAMQVARLPKGFVNPYIRDYARAIGLDPAETVEAFNEQCGVLAQAPTEKVKLPSTSSAAPVIIKTILFLAALALAGFVGWTGYQFISTPTSEPVADTGPTIAFDSNYTSASRAPVTSDPALGSDAQRLNLDIRATRRAWIDIRGADGTQFVDRQLAKGEVYDLRVGAGWTLSTQDAGAFVWVVDGQEVAPLGADNVPMYTVGVDAQAAEIRRLLDEQAAAAAEAAE